MPEEQFSIRRGSCTKQIFGGVPPSDPDLRKIYEAQKMFVRKQYLPDRAQIVRELRRIERLVRKQSMLKLVLVCSVVTLTQGAAILYFAWQMSSIIARFR